MKTKFAVGFATGGLIYVIAAVTYLVDMHRKLERERKLFQSRNKNSGFEYKTLLE